MFIPEPENPFLPFSRERFYEIFIGLSTVIKDYRNFNSGPGATIRKQNEILRIMSYKKPEQKFQTSILFSYNSLNFRNIFPQPDIVPSFYRFRPRDVVPYEPDCLLTGCGLAGICLDPVPCPVSEPEPDGSVRALYSHKVRTASDRCMGF